VKRLATLVAVLVAVPAAWSGPSPAAADEPAESAAKVTRSAPVAPGEYPAQVALVLPGTNAAADQYCGGTVIHPSWVLTAAHCLEDAAGVQVLVGTERLDGTGRRVAVSHAVAHPGFDFPVNDIALLRLATPVSVTPARLAYAGMSGLEAPGTTATVTGWGYVDAQRTSRPVGLQEADVPVIGDDACDVELNRDGRDGRPGPDDDLPDVAKPTLLCAGVGSLTSPSAEADACFGDSGGPLWAAGRDGVRRQIGVVAGGPTCGFSPSYYSSVEAFLPFIESTTGVQFASFTDIPLDAHERDIEHVVLQGWASGIGGGRYGPALPVSRGQMATLLARALGLTATATGPFTDVAGSPHEQQINAVALAGIAGGFGDATFRPA
jgi:secreted trypsin-like serine protease